MSLSPKETTDSDLKNGHIESQAVEQKPASGSKFKRHCARFWWVHLIVFCVVFLIVSLCLVYVGLPRIAQHDVDESRLEFTDLQFLDPTPKSIVLTQKSVLNNPSKFTPTLDAFNVSLYLVTNDTVAEKRIMYLTLPEIHATKPTAESIIENQTVMIEDEEELTKFAIQVLKNEEVTTRLEGNTKLHLGKLPTTNVKYRETATFKGLNGLKGFNVTGARVNLTATPGEPNLQGYAFIPNPSIMTIEMGNVTLSVLTEKSGVVGEAKIYDMVIKPGNNTLHMIATVNRTALLANTDANGVANLIVTGKEAVYNGEHLTYYEKALASNNLTLPMNVRQVVADSLAATGSSEGTE